MPGVQTGLHTIFYSLSFKFKFPNIFEPAQVVPKAAMLGKLHHYVHLPQIFGHNMTYNFMYKLFIVNSFEMNFNSKQHFEITITLIF